MATEKTITINLRVKTNRNERLDVYLSRKYPWKSRAHFQNMIGRKKIRVNGSHVKSSLKLRRGDEISIVIPSPVEAPLDFRPGEIEVLYEDKHIIVLNKPQGIITHPVTGHQNDTLLNYVIENFGNHYGRPLICHRLDRETSGAIMFVFDLTVRRWIQWQFEQHKIQKTYLAIVRGTFPPDLTVIDKPINAGNHLESALKGENLKESKTRIRCLKPGPDASLIQAVPVTGRQNQIRIHLASAGYPVVGDTRFGDPELPPTSRFFLLHARQLHFYHPALRMKTEISASPPIEFINTMEFFNLS